MKEFLYLLAGLTLSATLWLCLVVLQLGNKTPDMYWTDGVLAIKDARAESIDGRLQQLPDFRFQCGQVGVRHELHRYRFLCDDEAHRSQRTQGRKQCSDNADSIVSPDLHDRSLV